jgi:type I restriction enzyme S subunit
VIRLQNIGDGRFLNDEAHISTQHFARLRKHEATPGDVVVAMLGSDLPRACLVPPSLGPAIVKADCVRLRPDDRVIDGRYAVAALNSPAVRRQAEELVHGVGRPRLGLKWFRDLRVPLAPAAEQQRLVEAIDSYLSRLDAGVASLEAAQRKLTAYRASVLKAAVEGRLVPTEADLALEDGRSYESAAVLLERILKERRRRWEEAELAKMKAAGKTPTDDRWKAKYSEPEPPGVADLPNLPEGWCWARVAAVGTIQLGRQRAPQHHTGPHMRPYLRVANVFEDRIDTDDVLSMNFAPEEFEAYRLEYGDILLNEGQSPHLVGRPAMYRGEVPGACFQNTLVRFKASSGLDPLYALVVFRAQLHARRYMRIAQITTNIAHLGAGRFAEIEFPLPPLDEQRRIALEIERVMSVAYASERSIEKERARCLRLRQSILAWAFDGRLVDQDPSDEPADALLARIRAERGVVLAAAPKAKRSRKLKVAS